MKITLTKIIILFTLLFSLDSYGQNTVTPDDLNVLKGEWTGTLTYMDYSSNKPFTMPAKLIVKQGKMKINFYYSLVILMSQMQMVRTR